MLEILVTYRFEIFIALAALVVAGYGLKVFLNRPTSEQLGKVKEWLLYAVTEAEKELGSGTGKIKLRYVYDMFLGKFPYLAQIVSFESFSLLVDEALDQFKEILNDNESVKEYVSK